MSTKRNRPARGANLAVLATAALFATSATSASATVRQFAARPASVTPFASASYKIVNVGGPPKSMFPSFSQPLGFNNTEQFDGVGNPNISPAYQQCIAWTGKAWVDIEPVKSLYCYPTTAISDADSKGVFKMAGYHYIATSNNPTAFYATVSPTTATFTDYPAFYASYLWAMNKSGEATGYTYYNPYGGFATNAPAVTTTGGSTLSLLQPGCVTNSVPDCVYYPVYYGEYDVNEGRSINKDGWVFAYATNSSNGQYVEYLATAKPSAYQFNLPTDGGNGPNGVRGIDDDLNVAYYEYDNAAAKYFSWIYSPKKNKATNLGTLPGNSCTQYLPVAINGPGRVLGIAQSCSFPADQTYWTWDPTNGMVAVSFIHTGFSSITLYLINDKGEIAGDFYTSSGSHHWSYLEPPTKL